MLALAFTATASADQLVNDDDGTGLCATAPHDTIQEGIDTVDADAEDDVSSNCERVEQGHPTDAVRRGSPKGAPRRFVRGGPGTQG